MKQGGTVSWLIEMVHKAVMDLHEESNLKRLFDPHPSLTLSAGPVGPRLSRPSICLPLSVVSFLVNNHYLKISSRKFQK